MEPQKRKVLHYAAGGKDLYGEWLGNLPDISGRAAIRFRVDRLAVGNLGDHRSIGHGVWELRIHCGPGYRVYYGEDGPVIVLLICGGDKRSQRKDIGKARRLWAAYRGLK